MRGLRLFIIAVFVIFTTACDEAAIVHDLTERDANEIMVLLAKNEIKATKHPEIKNQLSVWIIKVPRDDEMRARSILVANNLPKIRQGGLKGICEDTSMIVTDETEQCRKLLAYKGEIINSLESIPGVVSADVVLNVPKKDEFVDENTVVERPTAAVTIMYLTDANVRTDLNEGKVQEFVANSISGLDARDVSVIISYLEQRLSADLNNKDGKSTPEGETPKDPKAKDGVVEDVVVEGPEETPPLEVGETGELLPHKIVSVGGIMMDEKSAQKFKIISAVFLVLLLLVSAAFIYALLRMSKLRKQGSVVAEPRDEENDDKKMLGA